MKAMIRFLWVWTAVLFGSTSFAISIDSDKTQYIFRLSGFSTCGYDKETKELDPFGTRMYLNSQYLNERFQDLGAEKIKQFNSCFGFKGKGLSHSIVFAHRSQYEKLQEKDLKGFWLTREVVKEDTDEILEILRQQVLNFVGDDDNYDLHIIGHSWGGWLAINLIPLIHDDVQINSLVSIDPVSPMRCQPRYYYKYNIRYVPTCREFPKDISDELVMDVHSYVGNWNHYFQNQFARLHSGPIEYLNPFGKNHYVKVKKRLRIFDTHNGMLLEQSLWEQVYRNWSRYPSE